MAPLVWGFAGVIAALQQAATYGMRGNLGQEWPWAVIQIVHWMLWAPFTPLIFAAAHRFPIGRRDLARSILVHLLLGLAAIFVVEGGYAQMAILVEKALGTAIQPNRPTAMMLTLSSVLTRLLGGFITYAAVLAVASALDFQRRLRDRDTRAVQLERDLAEAQIQAIKMQVQPHFLFNTLHAVNVLITKDPATATRMVTHLGDLLRHTLSRPTVAVVPLRSELEMLRLYLAIERIRFPDRLIVVMDIGPDTEGAMVPDLVLQPLVENAVKHGVAPSASGGTVSIRTRREGSHLVLEVLDTGSGPRAGESPREGIGLSTVRARLERLYGDDQSLTIERDTNSGCIARITLPFRVTPRIA